MIMAWVIYWEKDFSGYEKGFVSYDNLPTDVVSEYNPVSYNNATRYTNKSDAEKTMIWYEKRGLGFFKLMKVEM